eukprot:1403974-Amphidinium_carterae.1
MGAQPGNVLLQHRKHTSSGCGFERLRDFVCLRYSIPTSGMPLGSGVGAGRHSPAEGSDLLVGATEAALQTIVESLLRGTQ